MQNKRFFNASDAAVGSIKEAGLNSGQSDTVITATKIGDEPKSKDKGNNQSTNTQIENVPPPTGMNKYLKYSIIGVVGVGVIIGVILLIKKVNYP